MSFSVQPQQRKLRAAEENVLNEAAKRAEASGQVALEQLRIMKEALKSASMAWVKERASQDKAESLDKEDSPHDQVCNQKRAQHVWTTEEVVAETMAASDAATLAVGVPIKSQLFVPWRRASQLGLFLRQIPVENGPNDPPELLQGAHERNSGTELSEESQWHIDMACSSPKQQLVQATTCIDCETIVDASTGARTGSTAFRQQHFRCGICLENRWISKETCLKLACCGSIYCAWCWAVLLERALEEHDASLLRCPTLSCMGRTHATVQGHAQGRRVRGREDLPPSRQRIDLHIPKTMSIDSNPGPPSQMGLRDFTSDLAELETVNGTPEKIEQLKKLIVVQESSRARRCPDLSCRRLTVWQLGASNELTCECGIQYCFRHGGAHLNETCEAYRTRIANAPTPEMQSYKRYAQKTHTKICPGCLCGIEKNGGCSHMTCSACGTHFDWKAAQVEVPCSCLNLYNPDGKLNLWGRPPCEGASSMAVAKLVAWRGAVLTMTAPVVVPVGLPIAGLLGVYRLTVAARKAHPEIRAMICARAQASRFPPGSFERTFHEYGNGRAKARWASLLRCFCAR